MRARPLLLRAVALAGLGLALLTAPVAASASCRDTTGVGGEGRVRWTEAVAPENEAALEAWCVAVGGPVLIEPPVARATLDPVEVFAALAWNLHVGDGDLERLIRRLQAGELTEGRPVEHFVLLLQEAARVGPAVPASGVPGAISASAIGSPIDASRSIEAFADRNGLYGFYAPSMRNGPDHREDRGNAILSTLPLTDPAALVLPYERQRRVAIAATVSLTLHHGESRSLRVVSAHFDNSSRLGRIWRSFGAGRVRQARALADWLDSEQAVALGGDFNTWWDGSKEDAVLLLRERFPLPQVLPIHATYQPPFSMPRRQADYLLFRLPEGWTADYEADSDWGGSDHAPLIGWMETGGRDVAAPAEGN